MSQEAERNRKKGGPVMVVVVDPILVIMPGPDFPRPATAFWEVIAKTPFQGDVKLDGGVTLSLTNQEEIVQVGTRKVKIREVLKGKILLFYL